MKEHPIIFNSEMVRAILDGRKTQTRRIIKPQPNISVIDSKTLLWPHKKVAILRWGEIEYMKKEMAKVASYQVGDMLWVRETWDFRPITADRIGIIGYKADGATKAIHVPQGYNPTIHRKWRSPYHMPRWAARFFLEITNIRVERVQDITYEDAINEGIEAEEFPCFCATTDCAKIDNELVCDKYILPKHKGETAQAGFGILWDSFNAKRGYGWDKNPWVWVIEFKRL